MRCVCGVKFCCPNMGSPIEKGRGTGVGSYLGGEKDLNGKRRWRISEKKEKCEKSRMKIKVI